jgi:hypothetical protein
VVSLNPTVESLFWNELSLSLKRVAVPMTQKVMASYAAMVPGISCNFLDPGAYLMLPKKLNEEMIPLGSE